MSDVCYHVRMSGRHRPQVVADVAALVRSTRTGVRMTQRTLSRRSGVSQSRISRLENLVIDDVSLGEVDALMTALNIRYWLGTDVPRVTKSSRDLIHGWCTAYVARRLLAHGWHVQREVEIGGDRWKGWIDVLAFDSESGVLVVIEVKTEVVDIGAIERSLNWYQREAPRAAQAFQWPVGSVASALLVLHTAVNERVLIASRQHLSLGFPGRASDLHALICMDRTVAPDRFLALIDPHSRRARWLRPTRSEGSRSSAPYVDYLDAARRLEARSPAARVDAGRHRLARSE